MMWEEKEIKYMKIVGNVVLMLVFFAAMLFSLSIINVLGKFEESFGVILLSALVLALIIWTEYRLLRKPLIFIIEKIERKVSEMKFIQWIRPTDQKKDPEEILLDAVLDVGAGFEKTVPCEKVWKVVSEWYGIDWMYLTGIYKKPGLKKERRICMYFMYHCSKLSIDQIAEEMSVKNGMKVFYEINELDTAMRKNAKLRNEVLEILEELR